MPPRRRTITIVLLLLLGGAIVNVAVAWGCVVGLAPIYNHHDGFKDERQFSQDEIGAVLQIWFADPVQEGYGTTWARFGWQSFSIVAMTIDENGPMLSVSSKRAGWPCRALYGAETFDTRKPESSQEWSIGKLRFPDWVTEEHRRWRLVEYLPCAPLWPGFAINTVFYAAVLWVLFAAPGMVRRHIRARRGLCPSCAYPVGTSEVCTECGCALNEVEQSP